MFRHIGLVLVVAAAISTSAPILYFWWYRRAYNPGNPFGEAHHSWQWVDL